MSINNLQDIIKTAEREERPEWYDFSDYEGYDYTLKNGRVFLIRPWEKESDISKLTNPKNISKPKEPFCYKSIKDFNERKSNKIPNKIWNLKSNFFSGKKTSKEVKEAIEKDSDLTEYFNSIKPEKEVQGKTYLPEDSLLTYLAKQENSADINIFNLRNRIYKTAKNIFEEKYHIFKDAKDKVKEITAVLFYDDLLREVFLGKNELKNGLKKDRIKSISEASQVSAKEIRYWTKEVKKDYIRKVIEHKKKNNLLTYTDLKQSEKIYGDRTISRINDEVSLSKKASYSDIAKKFGLKNSKVVGKVIRNSYEFKKEDTLEKLEKLIA